VNALSRPLRLADHALQWLLTGIVRGYRLLLSPWLGSGCRFEPTCSRYALEALATQGGVRGAGLTAWRLLRCHPWCQGGHDPVPTGPGRGLFTRLLRETSPADAGSEPDAGSSSPILSPVPSPTSGKKPV